MENIDILTAKNVTIKIDNDPINLILTADGEDIWIRTNSLTPIEVYLIKSLLDTEQVVITPQVNSPTLTTKIFNFLTGK